jgi:hypothetical protein
VGAKADVHLRMELSTRIAPQPSIGAATTPRPAPRLGWTTVLPADEERLIRIALGRLRSISRAGTQPVPEFATRMSEGKSMLIRLLPLGIALTMLLSGCGAWQSVSDVS